MLLMKNIYLWQVRMRLKCLLSIVALLVATTAAVWAESEGQGAIEAKTEQNNPSVQKDPKTLILIIASDGVPAYIELQKIWKSYMHSDPEHFEVYFIRGNPDLTAPYEIKGDDLIVKCEESYVPGITRKTVLSIEAMMSRMHEFDYLIRTNLSSFYVFPRLLEFLKTSPKKNFFCGWQMHIPASWTPKFGTINFVSGAGIILSTDLARMLVLDKEEIFKHQDELADDVLIGLFFQRKNIRTSFASRVDYQTKADWFQGKDKIPADAFHFRAKNNYRVRAADDSYDDELYIDNELLNIFYPGK